MTTLLIRCSSLFLGLTSAVLAQTTTVTYQSSNGLFVNVAAGNPWGASSGPGDTLAYQLTFNFVLPTTGADLYLADPTHAQWVTSGSGAITANSATVNFSGPITIDLYASGPILSDGLANFSFASGLNVSFQDYAFDPTNFPDDDPSNLLNGTYAAGYVSYHGTVNDIDSIQLRSVQTTPNPPAPAPDAGSSFLLLIGGLSAAVVVRRRLQRAKP